MPEQPHVVVLGAGPAGAGAAHRLRRLDRARVTVVELGERPGGNAGSFELGGQRVDFGSHRLHPACHPEILADVRRLLGGDLLDRPRHGRIRLRGRWIHFPLKPLDLLLRLDPRFAAGTLRDAVLPRRGTNGGGSGGGESFGSVLMGSLGPTICREFYFPYARKIWGREPEELSAIQARRRVSAGSFGKLVRKVAAAVPGLKPPGAGRFFYPRRGFGQITEAYLDAAREDGAEVLLGWRATRLRRGDDGCWTVTVRRDGAATELRADRVWSTLPVPLLARMVHPAAPDDVLRAAEAIRYRSMILVYLSLPVERLTEYDAHYFPGADVRITRLSEPKNYVGEGRPAGRTVLCAELPCSPGDGTWEMEDAALGELVAEDLARAGLPLPAPPTSVEARRLRHAYPVYLRGYEEPFGVLDRWAEALPGVLTYGRQGLFAHDNTHHALRMAYAAADCLRPGGGWDADRWRRHRAEFETHVVED